MYRDLTTDVLSTSLLKRLWSKIPVSAEDDCWEWDGARTPAGYGRIQVFDPTDGRWRVEYAHRLVLLTVTGEDIPTGMVAMHLCDNPPCCNPSHIRRGTPSENAQDREDKGRRSRPPRTPTARDYEFRRLYESGMNALQIAEQFSMNPRRIYRSLHRAGTTMRPNGRGR